jgi:hypothetical protein
MKRPLAIVAVVAAVALAGVGGYFLLFSDHVVIGPIPQLRPAGDVPEGYTWELHDGPDFYTWVLTENEKAGDRVRSGVGVYFGHHPDLSAAKKAPRQFDGRAFSKKVTWMEESSADPKDPWIRRDATLRYHYGKGYGTIMIHVWVWGQAEEQVVSLTALAENLEFVLYQHQAPKPDNRL